MGSSSTFIIIASAATLLVLVTGVILMAVGGKANLKYSNKLMSARVIFQALTIVLMALSYFLYHKSK